VPLPTPRSGVAAALYKGMILVLGGELPPNHTFPENEGYDAASDRWAALAPMPAGRHGFGGAVIGSNAYFVGGLQAQKAALLAAPSHTPRRASSRRVSLLMQFAAPH
jgi:hypothetical protein